MTREHETSPKKRRSTKRPPGAKVSTRQWSPRSNARNGDPKLLEVLEEHMVDGELVEVTRMDKIVEYIGSNASITAAAHAAGVEPGRFHGWLAIAAEARAKKVAMHNGLAPRVRLTDREKVCIVFAERVEGALAANHVRAAGALTMIAEGGYREVVRTEKVAVDENGVERVIERSDRSQIAAPNVAALTTLLTRRFADTWGSEDDRTATSGASVRVTVKELGDVIDGLHAKIVRRQAAMAAITAGPDVEDAVVVSDEIT